MIDGRSYWSQKIALRKILNLRSYKLEKFLVPVLRSLPTNEVTINFCSFYQRNQ